MSCVPLCNHHNQDTSVISWTPFHPMVSGLKVFHCIALFYMYMFQVQEDIDQLRVSQVEKQLQLKEAATRRKIQELKQQLLQSPNTTHISPSTSPPGTGRPSPNHPMVESHTQTHVIPKSQPIKHPHPHSPGSETPQTIALHFGHSAMSNWVKKTPPELLKSPESHEKLNFTPLKTKPTEISSQSHIQVTPSAKHSTVLSGGLDQTSSNMAAEISPTPNVSRHLHVNITL